MDESACVFLCAHSPQGLDKTFLVTGGFGGLGLSVAQKLVDMGASSIALVSRSGKVPAGDEKLTAMFEQLQNSGAQASPESACSVPPQ